MWLDVDRMWKLLESVEKGFSADGWIAGRAEFGLYVEWESWKIVKSFVGFYLEIQERFGSSEASLKSLKLFQSLWSFSKVTEASLKSLKLLRSLWSFSEVSEASLKSLKFLRSLWSFYEVSKAFLNTLKSIYLLNKIFITSNSHQTHSSP
jgi:hypothetical protein